MSKPDPSLERTAVTFRRFNPATNQDCWWAEFEHEGKLVSLQVSDIDAWNYDIFNDLPVRIRITGDTCRILARLKNNKKFVRVRTLKKNV